jgi:hypothetical protein
VVAAPAARGSSEPASAPAGADSVAVVEPPTRYPAAARVVAFGDVHGDLAATRAALRLAGAIDANDAWTGEDLVLVQTGDQLDRGDDEREIVELFDRLREQARAAGGTFVVLNGNHELMNVQSDMRYVTPGGFADFVDVEGLELSAAELEQVPDPMRPRVAAFLPGGPWARRLAQRNVIAIVGDSVFVHGGVLPEHVDAGLERLNAETRAWLRGEREQPPAAVVGERGLVWLRDYSEDPIDEATCDTLARALGKLGAARLVVGHTVQSGGVTQACQGRVWRIDVGMAAHYGGQPAVLEIAGDQVRAIVGD